MKARDSAIVGPQQIGLVGLGLIMVVVGLAGLTGVI